MAIATEVDFDYVNKRVYRHGSASSAIHSSNELYSYIQTVFDDLTQMDDKVPMSAATPTSYKFDNGWYLEEEVMRHLDGGAIDTTGYTDDVHVLTLDGTYTNFIPTDIGKQVTDDAAEVGALLDYDNDAQKIWVRIGSSTVIADSSAVAIASGTGGGDAAGDSATGETLFANPYTLGTITGTPALYIYQDGAKLTSWWADGHFDMLIKVKEAGVDIDSKKVYVNGRNWTDEYTSYEITLTSAGQNAVPLGNKDDLNNQSTEGDVEDMTDGTSATIAIGFNFTSPYTYDIGDGNGVQNYNIQIDCNGQSLGDVYEVCKWWTREGSTTQLETESDDGFINGEAYRYAKSAYSEVVASPLGTFAGGTFFGAQGVYFTNLHADDAQSFILVDAAGTSRTPPNYQAFAMGGLETDAVVTVYESTGASSTLVNKEQYTLDAGANATDELTISGTIPSSTPTADGYIIVVDDDGSEIHYPYTDYDSGTDTFNVTITASTYSGGQYCYVAFLYDTSAGGEDINDTTTIYTAPITVVGRVRLAGKKPYEAAGTYGSTGYSATAILDTDSIYT